MKTRLLSAVLACTLAVSLTVPACAARVGDTGPRPAMGTVRPAVSASTSLDFAQLAGKVQANNPNVQAMQDSLKAAKAMDFDDAIDELEDAIDDLKASMKDMTTGAEKSLANASAALGSTLAGIKDANDYASSIADITSGVAGVSAASAALVYGQAQKQSLQSTLDQMEDQLDALEDQARDYKKTLQDTEHQIDNGIRQIVAGAESLYVSILSTELQLDALADTQTATGRTMEELSLRQSLGQISALTFAQVQQGKQTLDANVDGLRSTIVSLKGTLQGLLGETPTGAVALSMPSLPTAADLSGVVYATDLAKARDKSYALYSAERTVEDADQDRSDAHGDYGRNSYQYRMAQHSYEAALDQRSAAQQSFELSFQTLYQALAPAQAALSAAENALQYQEKVYAAAQLKYSLGNLSANALADAKDTLATAERTVTSAQLDLFSAWHSYRNAVEYGLVSSQS